MKETASQKACVNWVVRKMSLELCIPTWVSPGSKQVSAMLLSLQKINSSLCARFAMHCLRNQPILISCIFLCLQIKEVIFCLFLPIDNQIGIFVLYSVKVLAIQNLKSQTPKICPDFLKIFIGACCPDKQFIKWIIGKIRGLTVKSVLSINQLTGSLVQLYLLNF